MQRQRATEYLAECMWPGVTQGDLADLDARADASAAATAGETEPVRYLGSMLVPHDEVVFFFFAAPSPRSVEAVARRAGIPFERVLESVRISGRWGEA